MGPIPLLFYMHPSATQNPLSAYAKNVTSSHGEDGIIEHIFNSIGTKNKWCLELGALNGTHDSNVWNLIATQEWHALLIEADVTYFQKLAELYARTQRVHCVNEFISFEGEHALDVVCKRVGMPVDFDLLVLDIDGNDYHVWDSMRVYMPRVVVIEYNPSIPNDIEFVQPRDMRVQQGSSLLSLTLLAERKGYVLVATTPSNAFFVQKELAHSLNISDNSLAVMHPDTEFYTRVFQLYDGTLVLHGCTRLLWHGKEIDQEAIQALPKHARTYPARTNPNEKVRVFKNIVRRLPLYTSLQQLRKRLRSF